MTVSATGRAASYAQETGEAWVTLLTIEDASFGEPVRLTDAGQLVVSGGQTYFPVPFTCDLVADSDDEVPQTQVSLDVVSEDVRAALEGIQGPADVTLAVVLGSQPDVVEAGPYRLKLTELEWDETVASGTLTFDPGLNYAYPSWVYTPATARGVF